MTHNNLTSQTSRNGNICYKWVDRLTTVADQMCQRQKQPMKKKSYDSPHLYRQKRVNLNIVPEVFSQQQWRILSLIVSAVRTVSLFGGGSTVSDRVSKAGTELSVIHCNTVCELHRQLDTVYDMYLMCFLLRPHDKIITDNIIKPPPEQKS